MNIEAQLNMALQHLIGVSVTIPFSLVFETQCFPDHACILLPADMNSVALLAGVIISLQNSKQASL